MNGNEYFLDTNIIVYLLDGNEKIAEILCNTQPVISFINELELLSKKDLTVITKNELKEFIKDCEVVGINDEIKNLVVSIRNNTSLKLSDAIIAASAIWKGCPLFTADVAFKNINGLDAVIFTA